jgi:uncharacterized protein YecT (DUF1311 family)
MKIFRFAAALIFCSTVSVSAQLWKTDDPDKAVCKEAAKTPLPAEAALIAQPKKWPQCISYILYSDKDYSAARRCAWEERLAFQTHNLDPQNWLSLDFGGSAVLAVLYANGEGVERNIPLAIRFTCELNGWGKSPSWMDSLQRMEKDPSVKEELSICDDSTGGRGAGLCAEYDAQIAVHHREEKLRRLTKGWSETQKSKFERLAKAKEDFALASGAYAGHFVGTLHDWYAVDAAESVRKEFIANLENFESGHLPVGAEIDYKNADAELNQAYRQKLADSEDSAEEVAKKSYETEDVKKMAADEPEYIRNLERAWLKYRDAWIDFALLRYPSINKYAWLTLLTKEQTESLRKIGVG